MGPPPKSIAGARSVQEMSTAAVAAWGPPFWSAAAAAAADMGSPPSGMLTRKH